MRVDIVGAGPAGREGMTLGGMQALAEAQLVIGAARVLQELALETAARQVTLVSPSDIAEVLAGQAQAGIERAAVAVSGDVGLYSLAAPLRATLAGMPNIELHEHPGVSSLQCLCARLHMPWQDAHVLSAHGRACDVAGAAQCHRLTFALTGGAIRAHNVCADLTSRGMGDLTVHVGENLCSPRERVLSGTATELARETFEDLACMLVENPSPVERAWQAPGLRDTDLTRGDAPMTKEEVRQAIVCKLRLVADACVWDIGAGTGSVSVECGLAACAGRVYAVEEVPERVDLIAENARKLGALNVFTVEGKAPAALDGLPAPTHAFIGGSAGSFAQIADAVLAANPEARMVASAVTIETLYQALQAFQAHDMANVEVVQLSVAKARELGGLHLMAAQNPVWIISGQGVRDGGASC